MKQELLNSIKQNNQTKEGLEFLYETLSLKEQKCWDEINSSNITNWTQLFIKKANQTPNKILINEVDTSNSFTYKDVDIASQKIKHFLLNNIEQYQIGLNYHNSFLFLATLIGINKAGKLAILFNNREPQHRQEELGNKSDTKVVFGNSIKGLEHFNIEDILKKENEEKDFKISNSLDDPAFVIFTSGTSGPSKGALFSHRRMIGAGIAWGLRTAMSKDDNCYIPLPLYHGNALAVAFSAVVYTNTTATIRVKFSTSSFFEDINNYKCSHMVYIGELFRYILNKYKDNPNKYLKVIFGNGLNKSLWEKVIKQFDITHVVEHFGSTEMPSSALTNWFDKVGYCGYLPPNDPKLNEMVLVDENYHAVEYGQYGQALFLVPSGEYKGYLDSTLDESKLYRELFCENDLWWKSGDLLQSHQNGFYTFIERLGDTYRFKGENVACVDVQEAIRACNEQFEEIVVYGISLPNIDGKIGMASLVIDNIDNKKMINQLYKKLKNEIASYAIPYIIKIQKQKHQTTSTLKIQKNDLAKDGIEKYEQYEHFVLIDDCYETLDQIMYNRIKNSEIILGK